MITNRRPELAAIFCDDNPPTHKRCMSVYYCCSRNQSIMLEARDVSITESRISHQTKVVERLGSVAISDASCLDLSQTVRSDRSCLCCCEALAAAGIIHHTSKPDRSSELTLLRYCTTDRDSAVMQHTIRMMNFTRCSHQLLRTPRRSV